MKTALLCLLMSMTAHAGPSATTADLAWLQGTWKGTEQQPPMEVYYSSPSAGIIVSTTKMISGDRLEFFEFERINEVDGSLVLTPYPYGKQGKSFELKELQSDRAVFENLLNDYPTRIIYKKIPEGLLVRIEGTIHGRVDNEEFTLLRQ